MGELVFSELMAPVIVVVLVAFAQVYLERKNNRNYHEKMYTSIFAPIDRIRVVSPNIGFAVYISKVQDVLFADELFWLIPPRLFDAFNEMKTANNEEGMLRFDKIIDNNVNELRFLLGLPHKYRTAYCEELCCVTRTNINEKRYLHIILLSLSFSIIWSAMANEFVRLCEFISLVVMNMALVVFVLSIFLVVKDSLEWSKDREKKGIRTLIGCSIIAVVSSVVYSLLKFNPMFFYNLFN